MKTVFRHAFAFAVAFGIVQFTDGTVRGNVALAAESESSGVVSGIVTTGDGVPIRAAVVSLQGERTIQSGQTDASGHFSISHLPAGTYAVRVGANGFDPLSPRTIGVQKSETTDVVLSLVRSSSSLATIGRVQANGGEALSTSSAPTSTINPQQYAAEGYTRVSDILQDDMSTTLVHPTGAGSTVLPTSVALRGPDPTETLVDIDGHQVNSGDTGDFDLTLLDPADYNSIELVKGISPSSLVGPDTIDGAINIRTLEPTANPHGLVRFSLGSYNSFGETLQNTGTFGRLGYALSLHGTSTDGEVNGPIIDASNNNQVAQVGSSLDGKTALGKLRYSFGNAGAGYAEFSFHDQSQTRDLSAALSSYEGAPLSGAGGLPVVDGFEGSSLAAHNAGYGLDVRIPLGESGPNGTEQQSLLFRHYTSLVSQSVFGAADQSSPYLYDDRDLIGENSLEFDRQFSNGSLTLQYSIRNENLAITNANSGDGDINLEAIARQLPVGGAASRVIRPAQRLTDSDSATASASGDTVLAQTQRAAVLRYIYDPTAKLHLTAAAYYSDYSIFGHEIDPRFGFVYNPDSRSALRFSVGTTYQAPQLPELYVPPVLPAPVAGIISTGNPNLQPDHATEYDLGASHLFETGPHQSEVSVDVYRVNLRAPASTYQPAGTPDANCGAVSAGGDGTPCLLSYAVNAGDGVYQGIEIAGERRLAPYISVRVGYAVRSAFLTSIPPYIQDGTLVLNEQDLGLPLQKATLGFTASPPRGLTFRTELVYEGNYNELEQPPYATLAAAVGYRWKNVELVVSGTNLTDIYDQHFTATNGGVPYGIIGPAQPTNSYALQGATVNVSVAQRF
jgi:outer membrane cobalamin receptor